MAQQFSRVHLSGGSNGSGVLALSSPVSTVHYTGGSIDEVWLYAANQGPSTTSVQIFWAQPSPGVSGSKIEATIAPASGLTLLVPGLILNAGLYITCTASISNYIVVYGFANRISNV